MNTPDPNPDIIGKYPTELVDGIDHILDGLISTLLRDGADPGPARNGTTTRIIALIDASDLTPPTESRPPVTEPADFPPLHNYIRDGQNKELKQIITGLLIFTVVFFTSTVILACMYAKTTDDGMPVWLALPIAFAGVGTLFSAVTVATIVWKRIQKGTM